MSSALSSIPSKTYRKNVFWPLAFGGIGASFKILDIQQYASGFKFGSAAILNQNPIFEMGSSTASRSKQLQA
jgi:hypothetical protein